MERNVHTPERLAGETQEAYRERRRESRRRANQMRFGVPVRMHFGHGRRPAIKAAGGIRQFKKQRRAAWSA